jgi:proteasome lid subunit RPN8/RPN11
LEEAKTAILLWTIPECPYRVSIPASVINEIRILAVEAFYSVPRGGVEIGGVFFGVRESNSLRIRAHRQIDCQYASGPSFTLSVRDQLGLSGLLDRFHSDPDLVGMVPLGWYHSHTRSEIFLSPLDLELYSEFFPERWQIAMVLRPANLHPTRAGFFFRDRLGAVKSDAPLQEFKLEPPDFGLPVLDTDVPTRDRQEPVAWAPVPASPSASPLEYPSDVGKVAEPEPVPVLVGAQPSPAAGPPPLMSAAAAAANGVSLTAKAAPPVALAAPPPDTGISPPVPVDTIPAPEPPVPVEIALPGFLALSRFTKTRNTGWIWALIAIVFLGCAGGAAVLKWGRLAKPVD